MTEKNKDVDLYEDLKKELSKTEVEDTSGAGTEKPKEEVITPKVDDKDEPELSEEDISKLSPRAQKRIREQAEKIKELSAKEIVPVPEEKEIIPEPKTLDFNNVDEFLNAVQDKDSRKLLETFAKVLKKENSTILAPIEAKNNEAKFDTSFSKYEKIDGFADYKEDLKKTFLRNPTQDIDSLFSKTVADLVLNKIKKVEEKPSDPNRGGEVDLDKLSTDDLYNKLESMRGK